MSFALDAVTFAYGDGLPPVLNEVTADIPAGHATVLLGHSGSGKTTLLSLLGRLLERPPQAGGVSFHGPGDETPYAGLGPAASAALRCRHFGFVFQASHLVSHLSCADNVALPGRLAGKSPTQAATRVDQLWPRLFAEAEWGRVGPMRAREVSGGQRQRVAVLRAVANDPDVVFADEPFSNLDPANADRVLDLLGRWRAGTLLPDQPPRPRTLILVCHDRRRARQHADRLLGLNRGGRLAGGRLLVPGDIGDDDLDELLDAEDRP